MMKKLLAQLAKKFPHDRIAPGVMVSWLADKELYYVAVHRFKGGLRSRKIIASANGPDFENTVLAVRKMVFHEKNLNAIQGEMR
jgi:hypothetical protein